MVIQYKIYTLNHPITNEVRYIGYTSESLKERLRNHIRHVDKYSVSTYKNNWIRKLLKDGLIPIIKLLDSSDSLHEALQKEIKLIAEHKQSGARLTNSTNGGEGGAGYKFTKEKIAELSLAKKGKKLCTKKYRIIAEAELEQIKILKKRESLQKAQKKYKLKKKEEKILWRISNPKKSKKNECNSFFGKKHSAESLKKMREAKLGKKHPKEFSLKMSKIVKGRACSEDTKKKIGNANKGRYIGREVSAETRLKLSEAGKGRVHTEETLQKMRDSHSKRKIIKNG